MDGSRIALIVAIVIVLLAVLAGVALMARQRRRRRALQERFGPEYDRTVGASRDRRRAEKELFERAQRRDRLNILPLAPAARQRYAAQWTGIQTGFVDDPVLAVGQADALLDQVMRERGYPVDDFATKADMVAVDHPEIVHHYRAAGDVNRRSVAGQATTEEMREAFVHYRALFERLLGDDADRGDAGPSPAGAATGSTLVQGREAGAGPTARVHDVEQVEGAESVQPVRRDEHVERQHVVRESLDTGDAERTQRPSVDRSGESGQRTGATAYGGAAPQGTRPPGEADSGATGEAQSHSTGDAASRVAGGSHAADVHPAAQPPAEADSVDLRQAERARVAGGSHAAQLPGTADPGRGSR
ncbi:MAG: hypothetical protein M3Q27_18745 [Actinomycetota bacterium]|nr:hypothetical protein [Actinomycetota bacterium]